METISTQASRPFIIYLKNSHLILLGLFILLIVFILIFTLVAVDTILEILFSREKILSL